MYHSLICVLFSSVVLIEAYLGLDSKLIRFTVLIVNSTLVEPLFVLLAFKVVAANYS